jgi:translation initiation factor IF-3
MVDFGKYQYEKKKTESETRKKQKTMVQKEIKF